MMLRSLWLGLMGLIAICGITPTYAAIVVLPPEFVISEGTYSTGGGYYTIQNNSEFYNPVTIIGFAVTNPAAAGGSATTTQTGWVAGALSLSSLGYLPAFGYADQSWFDGGLFDGTPALSNDIGPGQFSNLFFWGPGRANSTAVVAFDGTNGVGFSGPFRPTVTPLPTAWTMMLIGLAALGLIAYRSQKPAAALTA
ncbi:MAG TPA: hypothetical protein VKW08_15455 [Xanthobacteraceae bacterium]|nr:hypothetical protein [Xanthobacteraceae bacterium]